MVSDCDSPEVQPRLEDQEGQSCLGIPVYYKGKKNSTVIQLTLWNTNAELSIQTSLLTVSPLCPGCPGSPSFPAGPWEKQKNVRAQEVWWVCTQGCVWCMSLHSQVGPLVLGNLLVPEGLADPETNKWFLVNNHSSVMETDIIWELNDPWWCDGTYPLSWRSWWAVISWVALKRQNKE